MSSHSVFCFLSVVSVVNILLFDYRTLSCTRSSSMVPRTGGGGRSQMVTCPVPVPVATWSPFGENATCVTGPVCRNGAPSGNPVTASQYRAVPSRLPV